MRKYFVFFAIFVLCCFVDLHAAKFKFDFAKDNQGWEGDFSDFPDGEEAVYELAWGWENLAVPLHIGKKTLTKGMFLSGVNHSDNLFMYIKRRIGGLKPNTRYDLFFHVTIENNIPPRQFGIGGSPGESVFFKVGASRIKPKNEVVDKFYRLNVDKGDQSISGKNALTVGDLANPLVNPNNPLFEPKSYANELPLKAKTDNKGRLWLFVGTDSGFEGSTFYYIAKIKVLLKASK